MPMVDSAALAADLESDPAGLREGIGGIGPGYDTALAARYTTVGLTDERVPWGTTSTRIFAVLLDAVEARAMGERDHIWLITLFQAGTVDLANPLVVAAIRARLVDCPITLATFDGFMLAGRAASHAEALFGAGAVVTAEQIAEAWGRPGQVFT